MATNRSNVVLAKRPGFFADHKNGEVNELKALLRNQNIERDTNRKREVIKKVIAYMTLGIDMSRLFSEMVLAASTSDIVTKKMCYLFFSNFAQSNEELATLCINTMTNDCQDSDPLVRGLALRSLSSLRLASTLEYLMPMMIKGFEDKSPYVRRNAVVAILKLQKLDKTLVYENGLVHVLTKMLYDRDSQVCVNSLVVLNEITLEEGSFVLSRDLAIYLLNRMKEFNEWGQCIILDQLARYNPVSEEELFAIMNILDSCLRVANSAVVLATIKCFLLYAEALAPLKPQIYLRIKQPVLTILASSSYELRYSVLKHVEIVIERCSGLFDDQFRQFYCHYNEPCHVKHVKLNILPQLANEGNVHELVQELSEYVNDVQQEIGEHAIESFGRVALKLPGGVEGILNQLLNLLTVEMDYVRTRAVIVIKNLLRKFPNRAHDIVPSLPRCLRNVEDSMGKAAVIFMLGEFGQHVRDTPYLLEAVVQDYSDDMSVEIRAALLTAVMKVFFVRPPECHGALVQLLRVMLNDTSCFDLHDRALFYYRLLRHDISEAKRCVTSTKDPVPHFVEERLGSQQDKLFYEFNSLSVIYDMPSVQFVDESHIDSPCLPLRIDSTNVSETGPPKENLYAVPLNSHPAGNVSNDASGDLLGFSDGLSDQIAPELQGQQFQPWALLENVLIDQSTFQAQWEALDQSASLDLNLSELPDADMIERLTAENFIYCMASGDLTYAFKFYFFGRDNRTVLHLAEVEVNKASRRLSARIKSQDPINSSTFADSLMAALGDFL